MPLNGFKQQGLTLVELLIGLLVGIVVLGAASSAFLSSFSAQTDNLGLVRLNQDMRTMTDIMARDIRRAGFVTSNPASYTDELIDNPFFAADKDIHVLDSNTCITYSYNFNEADEQSASPKVAPTVDGSEHFGFRLVGNVLQMRKSGSTNTSCNGTWETITEPDVEISKLEFTLNTKPLNVTSMVTGTGDDDGDGMCDPGEGCETCVAGEACLYVRSVSIELSGRLKNDPDVSQTIHHQVRIRNDKFVEAL